MTNQEAEQFLNAYFAKFPEIKVYMDKTIKFCRKSGYIYNIFGRKSHFININDKNYNVRNFQNEQQLMRPYKDLLRNYEIGNDKTRKKIK